MLQRLSNSVKKRRYEQELGRIFKKYAGSEPVIYDIGANIGEWSKVAKRIMPRSEIHAFEPLSLTNNRKKIDVTWHQVLLSNTKQVKTFYYSLDKDGSTGSSLYQENSSFGTSMNLQEMQTEILDDYTQNLGLRPPDAIKIDTQGSEIDILEGAKINLKNVKLIICEVPIIEYNNGAPRIEEYLSFFEINGFKPASILDQHVNNDLLMQLDVVFVR